MAHVETYLSIEDLAARSRATIRRSPIVRARASAPVGTTENRVPATDFPLIRHAAADEAPLRACAQRSSVVPAPVLQGGTACPMESVDGLRPPSLPTGPTKTAEVSSKVSFMGAIPSRFHWTMWCPKKPGPAHNYRIGAIGWEVGRKCYLRFMVALGYQSRFLR